MNLISLILYGGVNLGMVLGYLRGKGTFYQFPFWAGMIALGWFFPQAIGGYLNVSQFPENAYVNSMLFATLCMVALWLGFSLSVRRHLHRSSWLSAAFNVKKLYYAGVVFCVFGFFFEWKLWSLPEKMLAQTQWSGATVKYLFLANVFKFGFITLLLLYLTQSRLKSFRYLAWLVPCLLFLLDAAVLRGRRAGMMDLVSYLTVSLWFVRRISIPRWVILTGLVCGLVLINGIRTYRTIMTNKDVPLSERLSQAANADYLAASQKRVSRSGAEFDNYVFYRQVYVDTGEYDYGSVHWNRFVFNYVPAQVVGRRFKESLMLMNDGSDIDQAAKDRYGHEHHSGTTSTGYTDAFGSFGWFGVFKFMLIGWIMGALYRHAMQGAFLGQLLYIYSLTTGMQSITHGTNDILIRIWIYFFVLGYPLLYWAKIRGKTDIEHVASAELQGDAAHAP